MIVCSCNVFSEKEVRSALARALRPPRVSQVYASLGYARQCGRCARTIKRIMDEASAIARRHLVGSELADAQPLEQPFGAKPAPAD
jgi:bacterioferritin-associated ferredoxin